MDQDTIAVIGFLSLIVQMGHDLKRAGLLTEESIKALEERASIKLKNAEFNDDADERSQLNVIEAALGYLKVGVDQLRFVAEVE